LFLARDEKIDIEQIEDDIKITIIKQDSTKWSKMKNEFLKVDLIREER
jgi:hypothetical protein